MCWARGARSYFYYYCCDVDGYAGERVVMGWPRPRWRLEESCKRNKVALMKRGKEPIEAPPEPMVPTRV